MSKKTNSHSKHGAARKREVLWLSQADAKEIEGLKRKFGVKSRPAVLRELFARVKVPKGRKKKK